jgi:hypothetical protein
MNIFFQVKPASTNSHTHDDILLGFLQSLQ